MSRVPISGIPTSYTSAQAGDTLAVDRSGTMGKMTYANLAASMQATVAAADVTVSGDWTFAGTTIADLGTVTTADINGGTIDGTVIGGSTAAAGSFTTVSTTGNIRIDKDAPEILFNETAGSSATHQATFMIRSNDSFIIGTNDSTGTFVSSDYAITVGASGATKHALNLEGVEAFAVVETFATGPEVIAPPIYDLTAVGSANVVVASDGRVRRSSSSAALKQDPQPIANVGATVDALNPLTFRSAIEGDDQERRYAGFYAEEVYGAFPEAYIDEGRNYDTRAVLALLCAEVKSLRARVAALEST